MGVTVKNNQLETNMKAIDDLTMATLRSLKNQHKTAWLAFYNKLEQVAKNAGLKNTDDMSEAVKLESFTGVGFTQEEAAGLMFVMTQDCMGQACTSVETIERWFCYEIR